METFSHLVRLTICNFSSKYSFFFFLLRQSFALVVQDGEQWGNLGSLQPPPPGFKWFSCLSLPNRRDYSCAPPHLGIFVFLVETSVLPCWPVWSQTSGLRWSAHLGPKVLGLQAWATVPSNICFLKNVSFRFWWLTLSICSFMDPWI